MKASLLVRPLCAIALLTSPAMAAKPKTFGPATSQPGDEPVHAYLTAEALRLDGQFMEGVQSGDDWSKVRPRLREEFFYMLGLSPMPEKTPLQPVITRTLDRGDYLVDMLHYQSRPALYVTANLYRPAKVKEGERLPAVLYVCGHSNMGPSGNKAAYQAAGIWFARHGYICLTLDSLQLSEIKSIHHGTYREKRWWWHARGYTPAGVECWNGIRGIDYLCSRADVDPERLAVTGLSGGGAATYWIAAADERIKLAVPVSGMADLQCYLEDALVDGHCDCMFMYNTFRWPWTQIAAMIAPRPMLFVNSDADPIFPLEANERIANRMERCYRLFGAGDLFDTVVSIGGHAYRKDIRQAVYRFINTHLKNDPRIVSDSELDAPGGEDDDKYAIPPEQLRVFRTAADLPADQQNANIDASFVPMAKVELPASGEFENWKKGLLGELRRVSFATLPGRVPAGASSQPLTQPVIRVTVEPNVDVSLRVRSKKMPLAVKRIVIIVDDDATDIAPLMALTGPDDLVVSCQPRGLGLLKWTRTNPPNTVERALPLIGTTADTGRVPDVIATARWLGGQIRSSAGIYVGGRGAYAVIAAYAALLESDISGVIAIEPPSSHMESGAPQFLNILRVCDIPDAFGMLAPRRLTLVGAKPPLLDRTTAIYEAAGAAQSLMRQ